MKRLVLLFLMLSSAKLVFSQAPVHLETADPGFLAESEHFIFFSHLWLNMHHFLYNKALAYSKSDIETVIGQEKWQRLDKNEREALARVLRFYTEKLTQQDLRRGRYHYSFKRWVVQRSNDEPLPGHQDFAGHIELLNEIKSTYLSLYWKEHHLANQAALNANINLIGKYEKRFIENLTMLCKAGWQKEKIRIDISYNSKRDIPYTTTRPTTHIVMDSKNSNSLKGNWFELLLHEASHHLIQSSSGFVGGTISNVSAVLGRDTPSQLWHAYLFYFSGKVAQRLLAEEGMQGYELYMKRNSVFASAWPSVNAHLPHYMANEISLADATKRIIEEMKHPEASR